SDGTQLRKLFVGGLSANISDEELRHHFGQYGELADVVVMKDRGTGRPRGFGFVTFSDESGVDAAQAARPHVLDGREVETKRAMPRTEAPRDTSNARADKMFLGGLGPDTTEEQVRDYFSQFGEVQAVEIAISRDTGKPRGFGFVTYRDPDSVDKAILHKPHAISGSQRAAELIISEPTVQHLPVFL
uniref:RRM domain-containing protein n=1 Tax=Macrostomum lignano TaxID=282301 RepID=A0A1I8GYS7_9PLAT